MLCGSCFDHGLDHDLDHGWVKVESCVDRVWTTLEAMNPPGVLRAVLFHALFVVLVLGQDIPLCQQRGFAFEPASTAWFGSDVDRCMDHWFCCICGGPKSQFRDIRNG